MKDKCTLFKNSFLKRDIYIYYFPFFLNNIFKQISLSYQIDLKDQFKADFCYESRR